jgi:hypothetical protein
LSGKQGSVSGAVGAMCCHCSMHSSTLTAESIVVYLCVTKQHQQCQCKRCHMCTSDVNYTTHTLPYMSYVTVLHATRVTYKDMFPCSDVEYDSSQDKHLTYSYNIAPRMPGANKHEAQKQTVALTMTSVTFWPEVPRTETEGDAPPARMQYGFVTLWNVL